MLGKMKDWTLAYLNYKKLDELTRGEMKKGGFPEGLFLLILSQLINLASLILSFPLAVYFVPMPIDALSIASALIQATVFGIILFYIVGLLMFLFSVMLGGKGSLDSTLYILCLFALCGRIISAPLVILSAIEPIAIVPLALLTIIGLYGLYAVFVALRTIHGISSIRSAGVIIISFAILLILIGILGVALGIGAA
jgi:hypothetical protein